MSESKLNRHLNMVLPVTVEGGGSIYVHATLVSREVFESNFAVFSRAFNRIYSEGHGYTAPRIAKLMLIEAAQEMKRWDGPAGVRASLLPEIYRLTNVLTPGTRGWETLPFDDDAARRLLDDDDVSEIENAIVYFTLASRVHRKSEARQILESALSLWGAQLTWSNVTEFAAGLPTSTPPASIGEKVTPSLIPV